MYCTNCGIELGSEARFCSSCGASLTAALPAPVLGRDWDLHVKVLGWLVIAHAAVTGLIALIVMAGGQFIQRFVLANPQIFDNPADAPPPEVVSLAGPITFLIGLFILLIAMPSVAAGVGLLHYRNWGRALTLVLSFLRLLEFPFGTATAIYSFWVLLSDGGREHFKEMVGRAEA